jgi:hypothetical protein
VLFAKVTTEHVSSFSVPKSKLFPLVQVVTSRLACHLKRLNGFGFRIIAVVLIRKVVCIINAPFIHGWAIDLETQFEATFWDLRKEKYGQVEVGDRLRLENVFRNVIDQSGCCNS